VSSYEFPFNERIRTYLRLEDLFKKMLHHIAIGHEVSHHVALISMLQVLDVIDRGDLKVDLLQELDRHKVQLSLLQHNPNIDQDALESTLNSLERCASTLRADHQKLGQTLRDNDWLMSVKQRTSIPGGVCEFDLPSYRHWLYLGVERRKQDFTQWLSRLMPMYEAISLILQLLRGSGQVLSLVAHNGAYQQQLSGHKPAQLLRIEIDHEECFPEVSANKYAINIRFQKLDFVQRPKGCEQDIPFKMIICNFTGASHN
jgi:cell division protein ZapD